MGMDDSGLPGKPLFVYTEIIAASDRVLTKNRLQSIF